MADNADDVLDNWEDEDTEVLERRMEERQKQQVKGKKKSQPKAASAGKPREEDMPPTPLEVQTHLPLRTADTSRTEYVAPIKILKRQVDAKGGSSATQAAAASSVQRKSLAEREADYASARARILGTGYRSSSDEPPAIATKSPSPSSSLRGPGPSPPSTHGPGEDLVKRQPKGPNGTKGFRTKPKS